ncbi:uncharacterized protein LOC106878562 [Octopus bimaculoides]|uniref:uncharacterized protein LOC106878562 n=1 Tax=Octopus bimaculoides TaxID=37653 RepID=UPI0022E5FC5E|nr:uncharacterized protein LOC106878562 [Octopus bimaculoides]
MLDEIRAIDVKTRKILTSTHNFHINNDIDRLYLKRKLGSRCLTSIQNAFECRIISLRQHLLTTKCRSASLDQVSIHDSVSIIRLRRQLLEQHSLSDNLEYMPNEVTRFYCNVSSDERMSLYEQKTMHGYVNRKLRDDSNIDHQSSLSWTNSQITTSHLEEYVFAVQGQEISTKYLMHKRDRDAGKAIKCDNRCRLRRVHTEDITHIISSCPKMSSLYYLPMRLSRTLYNEIHRKENPKDKEIRTRSKKGYWWNVPVKTSIKCKHNKPDIMIWDGEEKL